MVGNVSLFAIDIPPLRALNVVRSGTAVRSCALIGPPPAAFSP